MPIGPDDVLCSNIQQEAGTLIVQFDGSCHADKGVGGAGAALLELQTQGVTLLQWRAPRSLLLRCFALRRNANLAGGFAGRFWLWWFCCFGCLFS